MTNFSWVMIMHRLSANGMRGWPLLCSDELMIQLSTLVLPRSSLLNRVNAPPPKQHAVATGTHPAVTTKQNIANFKRQLKSLGFSYDWVCDAHLYNMDTLSWIRDASASSESDRRQLLPAQHALCHPYFILACDRPNPFLMPMLTICTQEVEKRHFEVAS